MSNESFYPLTSKSLEKLYQANLTAAEWRLWTYLVVTDPWGDNYKDLPDTLTIMEKVGIKKSTFYAAIAKFQKFELFDFQDKGFAFRNLQGVPKVRNTVQDSGSFSEISESVPKSRNAFRKNGTLSKNLENQPPEPSPSKTSEVPQTIQTYSDFIKTLSEEERANFLNFCESKTKNLSEEVNDIEAWLAHTNKAGKNRWEVYYEKYLAAKQTQAKKTENKSALDEFRRELEEIERQAQKAWEEAQNQNCTDCGGET